MQRINTFHYVSPTGGNLQMTSNPKNWLLYIERQNQSKSEVWSERALMFIDAAETSLFRLYFSEILHSLLLETNKNLSLWSRLRCFFLAHQQIFICCFHCCHFTDRYGLPLSFISSVPCGKSRSQWTIQQQVDVKEHAGCSTTWTLLILSLLKGQLEPCHWPQWPGGNPRSWCATQSVCSANSLKFNTTGAQSHKTDDCSTHHTWCCKHTSNVKESGKNSDKSKRWFLKLLLLWGCRVWGLLNIKVRQIAGMSTRLKTLQSNTDRLSSHCGILI